MINVEMSSNFLLENIPYERLLDVMGFPEIAKCVGLHKTCRIIFYTLYFAKLIK